MSSHTRALAEMLTESEKTVVFTGAGISTESGIPDFRSPGGIWDRYNPKDFVYPDFLSSEDSRSNYWKMSRQFYAVLREARPNGAHLALARLERLSKLECIITQNVDRLHRKAGNSPEKIIELHGTVFTVSCLSCRRSYSRDEIEERLLHDASAYYCDGCGGFLKPDTVSFGQSLPAEALEKSYFHAQHCSLFLVIGSSLTVNLAAQIPLLALHSGARVVIIGIGETPMDEKCSLVIRGKAGETLTQALKEMEAAFGQAEPGK